MFKTINTRAIAVSLSLLVVMQAQALSGSIASWGATPLTRSRASPIGTGSRAEQSRANQSKRP